MELTLFKHRCRCEICGKEFDVLAFGPEGRYGEYILYGKNGQLAYWRVLEDPVFSEASDFVDIFLSLASGTKIVQSTKFVGISGICCDPRLIDQFFDCCHTVHIVRRTE
jgi:hypothetical protein